MNEYVVSVIQKLYFNRLMSKATKARDIAECINSLKPVANSRGLKRFGPPGDGGYLAPDDLDGVIACISPGVSTESRFDQEIGDRGIDVYMADASVDGPPIAHPRFHFTKKFLDVYESENTITINEFCRRVPGFDAGGDMILQMDIESAEYRVLLNASDEILKRFRIMIIELHDLDKILFRPAFNLMRHALQRLVRYHAVVHIHPNNCCKAKLYRGITIPPVMEITLYRRDRATFGGQRLLFPHPLDADNVPHKPTMVLPACWR